MTIWRMPDNQGKNTDTHSEHRHALRTQTHTQNTDTHSEHRHALRTQTRTQNTDTHSEHRHALSSSLFHGHRERVSVSRVHVLLSPVKFHFAFK